MTWGHVHHPNGWFTPRVYSATNVSTAQQGQNDLGRITAVDQNDFGRDSASCPNNVLVEDVRKGIGGPVLKQNPATSLEFQQFMHAMETMAQTMATQNAQINERFD
ncbi:unnamed protein product [Prunus armeniaca]